ncbi:hypothetical protein HRbin30_01465 [bacterium HR30]|nr:hypothetical protein HRbin30_01465 [bacterium HR30]
MFEDATYGMHGQFTQAPVAVAGKQRSFALPHTLVRVHSRAVVTEDWLGHKRHGFSVPARYVLHDVLVPVERVGHFHQRQEAQVDFRLSGGGHLVVMLFHSQSDLFHHPHHF